MSDLPDWPTPDSDWRDMRREERRARRDYRHDVPRGPGTAWIAGLVLIAVGVIFLAQNFGYPLPYNWWAAFLLLPAAACFGSAWTMYQRNGRQMTPPVTSAAITGIFLTALAVIFLMGLDLGKFWPVILIVLGLAILFGGGRWSRRRPPQ